MEKINVAEILKNCPQGMELDCTMYENCTFDAVFEYCLYPIQIKTPVGLITLNKYGSISKNPYSKCMIFPKGKTTWEGFVPPCKFKDGDIVVAVGNESVQIFLLKQFICSKNANNHVGDCFFGWDFQRNELFKKGYWSFNRLATEEEKEKLFDAIKANGYKWNSETKTLEVLHEPKFKVGNRIIFKNIDLASKYGVFSINRITEDEYVVVIENTQQETTISIQDQNGFMIAPEVRLVLEKKFDITTLIPFESKVLVRDGESQYWRVSFWGCLIECGFMYDTVRGKYRQCIPYEGNEHLLGKTDDCDDFYKTWE